MIEHISCKNKYGFDNNEYLISFLKHIQKGWNPLQEIVMTKELYQDIKKNKDAYPKHIVGLAGFCASYNSKWFGGYAGIVKTKTGVTRNYYEESVRNCLKQASKIQNIVFKHTNYLNIDSFIENHLIYCDPPYANCSIKYKEKFNHSMFWDWIRDKAKNNTIYISEHVAPDDFESIWQKDLKITFHNSDKSKVNKENLFILKQQR